MEGNFLIALMDRLRRASLFRCTLLALFACIFISSPRAFAASATYFRARADHCVERGEYEKAARYYRLEAAVYRRKGDPNAACVEEMKAERWTTEVDLYTDKSPDRHTLESAYTGARYEPLYGCYLGVYCLCDYDLPTERDPNGSLLPSEMVFGNAIQKPVATAFDYCRYGDRFPLNWARGLLKHGIAPQIALEPNDGLRYVKDNEYLRQFARDAASCKGPVFLRYASEMNGYWTNYHGDPGLYRRKFRLVHDVMRSLAPNVAMIWCVYQMPEDNIDSYYPGDAYVDWVGINIYSVLHHDDDPTRPAWYENPSSMLKYVYDKYAWKKPIAICEYGASHQESLSPGVDYSGFAVGKMADLFSSLPRKFPRVKMIDIFDCNNINYSRAGRKINNYCVTDDRWVLGQVRHIVDKPYFLSKIVIGKQNVLPTYIQSLDSGASFNAPIHVSAWVKTYINRPTVVYKLDGRRVACLNTPGDYSLYLTPGQVSAGRHHLTLQVLDNHGRSAGRKEVEFVVSSPTEVASRGSEK